MLLLSVLLLLLECKDGLLVEEEGIWFVLELWWIFWFIVGFGVLCAVVMVGELLSLILWSWIELGDDDEYEEVNEYGEDVWFLRFDILRFLTRDDISFTNKSLGSLLTSSSLLSSSLFLFLFLVLEIVIEKETMVRIKRALHNNSSYRTRFYIF